MAVSSPAFRPIRAWWWRIGLVVIVAGVAMLTLSLLHAAPPNLKYRVGWVGNSFAGAEKWVQQDIEGMLVTDDGTVLAVTGWDEAGREVGAYKDGDVVGIGEHTHGWGNHGGSAIAVNAKYLFFAQHMENEGGGLKDPATWPPKGSDWYGISRRQRADITAGAPFAGGKGGSGATLKSAFLMVNEVPNGSKAPITGLCADDKTLFVGNPALKEIRVYDAETMALLTKWTVERTDKMILDKAGTLWVIQTGDAAHAPHILHFTAAGTALPHTITFANGVVPSALCFDPAGRLVVADDGKDQQLLVYDRLDTTPKLVSTIGQRGGIFAGTPGKVGPLRFNHITGVGYDAKGNLYVASCASSGGGGTVLESYSPKLKINWTLHGLEFVDMADIDPRAPQQVYTKEEHFSLKNGADGKMAWAYVGHTVNRFKYPDDPRLHIWSAGGWVRYINNTRFLFVTEMNAGYLQVYRFNARTDGEVAIPSGLFVGSHINDKGNWPPAQPGSGEWIWRDTSGNGAFEPDEYAVNGGKNAPNYQGWWVDSAGSVWRVTENDGIQQFPCQGLDGHGNPIWSYASLRTFPKPAEFHQVKRLRYDPKSDTMYLGGVFGEDKNQHWKPMGPVICRYDHWSKTPKLRWRIVAPYEKGASGHSSCEPMGFDVAGDYLFVPYTGASKALNYTSGHIGVYRADTGVLVNTMEPTPEIGEIGLQDIRECLSAYKSANGEYLVFLEEDWKSKILLYRWKP